MCNRILLVCSIVVFAYSGLLNAQSLDSPEIKTEAYQESLRDDRDVSARVLQSLSRYFNEVRDELNDRARAGLQAAHDWRNAPNVKEVPELDSLSIQTDLHLCKTRTREITADNNTKVELSIGKLYQQSMAVSEALITAYGELQDYFKYDLYVKDEQYAELGQLLERGIGLFEQLVALVESSDQRMLEWETARTQVLASSTDPHAQLLTYVNRVRAASVTLLHAFNDMDMTKQGWDALLEQSAQYTASMAQIFGEIQKLRIDPMLAMMKSVATANLPEATQSFTKELKTRVTRYQRGILAERTNDLKVMQSYYELIATHVQTAHTIADSMSDAYRRMQEAQRNMDARDAEGTAGSADATQEIKI